MDSQYYNSPPPAYSTANHAQTATKIHFNFYYAWTIPGMLKIACMILDLIGFICDMCTYANAARIGWFGFVSMAGFLFTSILLMLYFFHVVEKYHHWPWLLGEFIYCTVWVVFYLIAASLVVSTGVGALIAAGVFGYFAMIVYGVDAFFKFMGWRTGSPAQGDAHTSGVAAPS